MYSIAVYVVSLLYTICIARDMWSVPLDPRSYDVKWDAFSSGSKIELFRANYWVSGEQSKRNGFGSNYEPPPHAYRLFYTKLAQADTDWNVEQPLYQLEGYDENKDGLGENAHYTGSCEDVPDADDYSYAMYKFYSPTEAVPREWTFTCRRMPYQFQLRSCIWTRTPQQDHEINRICDTGLLRSVEWRATKPRRWRFECCDVGYWPMDVSTSPLDRLLTDVVSHYVVTPSGTRERSIDMAYFGRPRWYDGNVVQDTYPLTSALPSSYYWVRVCPLNGALTHFAFENGIFDFECGVLVDEVSIKNCEWTDYMNDFYADFIVSCDQDGPIRGVQSYYSDSNGDRKFKFYCCKLKRENYEIDDSFRLKITGNDDNCNPTCIITLNVCWDNYLYQAVVNVTQSSSSDNFHQNYWAEDVVQYGTCNNRVVIVSAASETKINIATLHVYSEGVRYSIKTFVIHESLNSTNTVGSFAFILNSITDDVTEVIVQFPDDYLTACGNAYCTADVYHLHDYQEYFMTITWCTTFEKDAGDVSIAMVLRGLNGNLDRVILTGDSFSEESIGRGNIGEIIHINIEYESGPDFCIQNIVLQDPYDSGITFGAEYFGDGVIFSGDCSDDGDFMFLSGLHYVPCYDTPYDVITYESTLYTSIQMHVCSGTDSGISSANSGSLSFTITGLSKANKFVSTDPYSLSSSNDWSPGASRDYTMQISGDFESIAVVTITNNDETDALCIDAVLVNGADAFLSHYWVGNTADHDSLTTIPAVVEWPICKVELTTTITAEASVPVDPRSVATAVCVNKNRLVPVECAISQSYETYEEISWEQSLGEEVTKDITMERGTETSMSTAFGVDASLGVEAGTDNFKITAGLTVSSSKESSRLWSSSTSVSNGYTKMEVTTDGTVNGETIGVECSGSVSVPPSQQIAYSLLIDQSDATLTTITDITMTKCSAYLYGEDHDDANDYIYIYGIKGALRVKESTNCYVSFSQAEQVSSGSFSCGEERALATREWGTYVPQCNEGNTSQYMPCQCAYGDSLTLPTCGCVDESSGNLLDSAAATVVDVTDTYTWTDWCDENCGSQSYAAAHAPPMAQILGDPVADKVSADYNENVFRNMNGYDFVSVMQILTIGVMALSLISVTYAVDRCITWWKKCKPSANTNTYQSVGQFDTDTDIEMDRQKIS
eukprot:169111_1